MFQNETYAITIPNHIPIALTNRLRTSPFPTVFAAITPAIPAMDGVAANAAAQDSPSGTQTATYVGPAPAPAARQLLVGGPDPVNIFPLGGFAISCSRSHCLPTRLAIAPADAPPFPPPGAVEPDVRGPAGGRQAAGRDLPGHELVRA